MTPSILQDTRRVSLRLAALLGKRFFKGRKGLLSSIHAIDVDEKGLWSCQAY